MKSIPDSSATPGLERGPKNEEKKEEKEKSDPLESDLAHSVEKDPRLSRTGVHPNRDPITGEPGSHALGTGLGSAGAAAAGAALGAAVGGPVGAAVGGVAGAVLGGVAGHAGGEVLNPTVEAAYWRSTYATRPYHRKDRSFEDLEPAYRSGWERAAGSKADQRFEDVEAELERTWPVSRGNSPYEWKDARDAMRDAWTRVHSR